MTKREKVIQGLECCIYNSKLHYDKELRCKECPYMHEDYTCINKIQKDALELLKAQEPIKPICNLGITRCGSCNCEIDQYEGVKYCPNCGKAVKWDDDA